MKKLIAIGVFLALFSCAEDNTVPGQCNADNPFSMPWMSEWIADLQQCACTVSIFQADYGGDPVFWQLMTDPLCQGVFQNVPVYSCLGEEILVLEDYNDLVEFREKVANLKIIYSCPTPHN